MPLMIGFSEQRLRILQTELDSIVERLPGLGVIKAILLNSLYPGVVERDTSLKLVMIMNDDRPFVRRPDFFYSHLSPSVAVEFLVLTPAELEFEYKENSCLALAIRKGEIIHGV